MRNTSFADLMTNWDRLLAKVADNINDLQHLEAYRAQLAVEWEGARAAHLRQSEMQVHMQQATRDLEEFLGRCNDLAVRIRSGVKTTYGNRSEKLIEFGLRPIRSRKASPPPPPPVEVAKEPAPPTTTTATAEPQ